MWDVLLFCYTKITTTTTTIVIIIIIIITIKVSNIFMKLIKTFPSALYSMFFSWFELLRVQSFFLTILSGSMNLI